MHIQKGNLCPSITLDLKPSLKFLFDFNWKYTCLETGINTGPVSEAFPLVNCWLQIYPNLAGSWDSAIPHQTVAEVGIWARGAGPGPKIWPVIKMVWVFCSRVVKAHYFVLGTFTLQLANDMELLYNSLQVAKLYLIIVIFSQLFINRLKELG